MSDATPTVTTPTAEQKRIAVDSYNRAKEAITSPYEDGTC